MFEGMLAMVLVAIALGVAVKFWVQYHQTQSIQRQAELLQTARLAGQQLVGFYRQKLLNGTALSTAIDGGAIPVPIAVNNGQWQFNAQQLIALKLLNSDFPGTGIYGSLAGAQLSMNLKATSTVASGTTPASTQVRGTVCYAPATPAVAVDTQTLSALMAHVSRNVSVLGSGSTFQSGVFGVTLPAAPSILQWAGGSADLSTLNLTPVAGRVCGLFGDWGGADATASGALGLAIANDSCFEPNALAWQAGTSGQPQDILWCNGTRWRRFMSGNEGDKCSPGQLAFKNDDTATPLWCNPATQTFKQAFLNWPQNCQAGIGNVRKQQIDASGVPKWCDETGAWQPGFPTAAPTVDASPTVAWFSPCLTEGAVGVQYPGFWWPPGGEPATWLNQQLVFCQRYSSGGPSPVWKQSL